MIANNNNNNNNKHKNNHTKILFDHMFGIFFGSTKCACMYNITVAAALSLCLMIFIVIFDSDARLFILSFVKTLCLLPNHPIINCLCLIICHIELRANHVQRHRIK